MVDEGYPGETGFDWDTAGDLTALPEDGLRGELAVLREEERVLAYRMELLRGRIGLVRAELSGRGLASATPEELARVLLGERGRGSS